MYHTRITIYGKLNPAWADWFEGLEVHVNDRGLTTLCGDLQDASAVYGVLGRLGVLGISLVSVTCEEKNYATI
jgi:hypothetical protein